MKMENKYLTLSASLGQKILAKARKDLQQGVKVLGDYSMQADTIRVWTKVDQTMFAIVATSSARFIERTSNYLEIQSLNLKQNFRLAMFFHNNEIWGDKIEIHIHKLNTNLSEQILSVKDQKQVKQFIDSYLQSQPNRAATAKEFAKNNYQDDKYQWLADI